MEAALQTMRTLFISFGIAAALTTQAEADTIHFDDLRPGLAPAGWHATATGAGTANWTVAADASAPSRSNVLKQSGVATFPVCLKTNVTLKDGFVEVKFKSVSGHEDQAGGVVWRAADTNNYYVCRANALENNVVLYKMAAGKRSALDIVGRPGGYGVKTPVTTNQWHTLRVEFTGARFKVVFNGRHLFDVADDTFPNAGQVGLWTKADSVTLFDDFSSGPR
jgi:hypothetical protein